MTQKTLTASERVQRILAYAATALIAVSVLSIFAILIGTMAGASRAQAAGDGIWRFLEVLPYYALPIGFLLLIAVIAMVWSKRGRVARDAQK